MEMRKEQEKKLDKIRGGLFGGAVGDALGYPVEFQTISSIESRYGKDGIRDYEPDAGSGQALISDDTQMTLFTANGILFGETRKKKHVESGAILHTILMMHTETGILHRQVINCRNTGSHGCWTYRSFTAEGRRERRA